MQSHDFASTYVGTPFYMSPEICAAERYTLQSDIWSMGCVIYELCARSPPFNAKTHFNLIQKIKKGEMEPLPGVYSQELQNVIKSCLNVNPLKRPDTTALLNVPAVRLVRKQREVVELGRALKVREEQVSKKVKEADQTMCNMNNERDHMKAALEASLRREWELKAGLEISRRVQEEKEKLHKIFEAEVQLRVQTEVEKRLRAQRATVQTNAAEESSAHLSSVSTAADTDFPSMTELSSISIESSPPEKAKTPPRRSNRGPLARAKTQFDSPMDVHMADPSPMSIAGLSLSPRRTDSANAGTIPGSKNIFAAAAAAARHTRLIPLPASSKASTIVEDDEDSVPDLPSPTRTSSGLSDPFKAPSRPGFLRQKTAPLKRLTSQTQPSLFPPTAAEKPCRVPSPPSPKPSGFSPNRKAPPKPQASGNEHEMLKAVTQRNLFGQNPGGRTLVELAQARAGISSQAQKSETYALGDKKENRSGNGEVASWDPEHDEMPSPFLARGGRALRRT